MCFLSSFCRHLLTGICLFFYSVVIIRPGTLHRGVLSRILPCRNLMLLFASILSLRTIVIISYLEKKAMPSFLFFAIV